MNEHLFKIGFLYFYCGLSFACLLGHWVVLRHHAVRTFLTVIKECAGNATERALIDEQRKISRTVTRRLLVMLIGAVAGALWISHFDHGAMLFAAAIPTAMVASLVQTGLFDSNAILEGPMYDKWYQYRCRWFLHTGEENRRV